MITMKILIDLDTEHWQLKILKSITISLFQKNGETLTKFTILQFTFLGFSYVT